MENGKEIAKQLKRIADLVERRLTALEKENERRAKRREKLYGVQHKH